MLPEMPEIPSWDEIVKFIQREVSKGLEAVWDGIGDLVTTVQTNFDLLDTKTYNLLAFLNNEVRRVTEEFDDGLATVNASIFELQATINGQISTITTTLTSYVDSSVTALETVLNDTVATIESGLSTTITGIMSEIDAITEGISATLGNVQTDLLGVIEILFDPGKFVELIEASLEAVWGD